MTAIQEPEGLTGPVEEAPVRGVVAVRTREDEQKSALARGPVTDIATMSDDAFEVALQRAEIAKKRVARILEHTLIEDAHYGNPKQANGRSAFKKPILYRAGAEILETTFRLTVYAVGDDEVIIQPPQLDAAGNPIDPGFVSVTVHRALYTFDGTRVGVTKANCNSREKRFKRFDGKGFTYDDARETLNDCMSMAEKRAKVRLVRGAVGLTPWMANEEEMEADREEADKPITPMTEDERASIFKAAQARGMGRKALIELTQATLGRPQVGSGADVKALLAAIAMWEKAEPAKADPQQPTAAEELIPDDAELDAAIVAQDQKAERGEQQGLGLADTPRRQRNAVRDGAR